LPFASSEPDSSIWYAKKQFVELGCTNIQGYSIDSKSSTYPSFNLDSIRTAALVYIPGGDQLRFMQTISGTGIAPAIRACYQKGGTIAGTSAGAAVMSKKMITGIDLTQPDSSEKSESQSFSSIEANTTQLGEGLGLLTNTIIDQHFIKRKRMNRLLAVAIENPTNPCIGIDESTAIWIKNGKAEVIGESQVVEIRCQGQSKTTSNRKLSGKGIKITIFTEGDRFPIFESKPIQ
ncbi:MAG: cyanophycinase, partial [Cytophagales bacterium]|nr:cyanophycinase [Cytophagales bacterium]